jgi:ADP-ribose pyrophosphatase YjhB (NUDIX family)
MPLPSFIVCPKCGEKIERYRNPAPTADAIIEIGNQIVLVERKFPPYGWAVPGGFVEYGETLEHAAVREAGEETSLDVTLTGLLGVYSDPKRDPRKHTITTVFIATARGEPRASDDAKSIGLFTEGNLPSPMAFDHQQVLEDYFRWKKKKR